MTPEIKTALARIDAIKAKIESTDNDADGRELDHGNGDWRVCMNF